MTQDEIKEAATRLGCWAMPYARVGSSEAHNLALFALVQEAIEAEREACANEAERMTMYPRGRQEAPAHDTIWHAARAIRARGQ